MVPRKSRTSQERSGRRVSRQPHQPQTRPDRKKHKRLLLVVEGSRGKSEQAYFELLRQELETRRLSVSVQVFPGNGEPTRVLKEAENRAEGYDHVCLLMDVDTHAKLDEVLQECGRKIPPFHAVVTNPKFELWLLWHKEKEEGFISSKELDKRVQKLGLVRGKDGKQLAPNFPIKDYHIAMVNAVRVGDRQRGKNPSSGIPWLIEAMVSGDFL